MTSIMKRTQSATRVRHPRIAALLIALLIVGPAAGLIFAAVHFGMRRRSSATPLSAADVAAAPVRARSVEPTPSRSRAVLTAIVPSSGNLLAGAAVIAAVVALGATAAAGSYAFLSSQQTIGTGSVTLTAGSLGLKVNGSSSSTPVVLPAGFSKLLPGDYYNQAITVTNSGNIAGNITAALGAASSPYEVRVSAAACPSAGYTTTALSATMLSTTPVALGQLAGGGAATGCLQIGLAASAPATNNGTAAVTAATPTFSPTITFTATQPNS